MQLIGLPRFAHLGGTPAGEMRRHDQRTGFGGLAEQPVTRCSRFGLVSQKQLLAVGSATWTGLCRRSPTKNARSVPELSSRTDDPGVCPGAGASVGFPSTV